MNGFPSKDSGKIWWPKLIVKCVRFGRSTAARCPKYGNDVSEGLT